MADASIELPREIVTRKEAKARGLNRYFNGKHCPKGHFSERRTADGGCVVCALARTQVWRGRNRAHVIAYAISYAESHPEQVRENDRRRYAKDPKAWRAKVARCDKKNWGKRLAAKRRWKKDNPNSVRASARRSYRKNPAKAAAKSHRRRALKIGNGGSFTSDDIADIRRMQRDKCAICKCTLHGKGEIDHIIPLTKRGSNGRRNLQLLCRPCNARKSAADQTDFMRSLGRLL